MPERLADATLPEATGGAPPAPPFDRIFATRNEAEWGFAFLRQTLDLLHVQANDFRACVLTLPKEHKRQLMRLNVGPWLLLDFSGPGCVHGKRIHLALLREGYGLDARREWFVFGPRHATRAVAVYRFTWDEVQAMTVERARQYVDSMDYCGGLFAQWRGSPYRLAHQPLLFAAIFDPVARASLLTNGLDPAGGVP